MSAYGEKTLSGGGVLSNKWTSGSPGTYGNINHQR